MGWACGFDPTWQRDIGYGVPATCDQPGCGAPIDRGLSYVCGGQPYGGDEGCGLYFCTAHLAYWWDEDDKELAENALCDRCRSTDDQDPEGESCHRCGGPNVARWFVPSPLWNFVMRGNDINGEARYGDLVCPECFIRCASEAGVEGTWRLTVDPLPARLIYETPNGRWWDDEAGMWVETPMLPITTELRLEHKEGPQHPERLRDRNNLYGTEAFASYNQFPPTGAKRIVEAVATGGYSELSRPRSHFPHTNRLRWLYRLTKRGRSCL